MEFTAFSENLQYIRAQAGLTQEQFAEALNVSRQSVSKWESATSFPEMDTLLQICELYDVNLDTLLRGNLRESRVEDTARYDEFMSRFAKRIAGAVAAIIAAAGLFFTASELWGGSTAELLAGTLFMLAVTVSTVVLVASGIQRDNFRKRYPVLADFYTQEEKDAFHQKFVWYIAGGVGAILFGVVLIMLTATVFGEEKQPYETLSTGLFLLITAGAVYCFIFGGITEDKYKIWKYNRDNNPAPEAKKKLDLIGVCCAVIMLTATAVYVGLGLGFSRWGTETVWLFAVGGILCGVVSIVLNPYKGEE